MKESIHHIKNESGMTLIELVIVIIVLGIVAAFAAPKFVDIKADAVAAAKDGVVGGFDSSYTLAVAKKKGIPTVAELSAAVTQMTCNGTSKCDSGDKDGVAGVDVAALFYGDDCTTKTATTAGTDLVNAYGYSFNAAAVSICQEF